MLNLKNYNNIEKKEKIIKIMKYLYNIAEYELYDLEV